LYYIHKLQVAYFKFTIQKFKLTQLLMHNTCINIVGKKIIRFVHMNKQFFINYKTTKHCIIATII